MMSTSEPPLRGAVAGPPDEHTHPKGDPIMASTTRFALVAGAGLLLATALAHATLYSASLDGLQSVPANGSSASGTVMAELTGSTLVVEGAFSGLLGVFTASHIHNAPAGSNGGVLVPLSVTPDGPNGGSFASGSNTFALSPTAVAALEAGSAYINVHSTQFPGGEIRGQLREVPVAAATETPAGFSLGEAWPNPFNPSATISYSLEETRPVTLLVHDLSGRRVATLVDGLQSAGEHEAIFDAAGLPSGLYLATLSAGGRSQTRKLTLLK